MTKTNCTILDALKVTLAVKRLPQQLLRSELADIIQLSVFKVQIGFVKRWVHRVHAINCTPNAQQWMGGLWMRRIYSIISSSTKSTMQIHQPFRGSPNKPFVSMPIVRTENVLIGSANPSVFSAAAATVVIQMQTKPLCWLDASAGVSGLPWYCSILCLPPFALDIGVHRILIALHNMHQMADFGGR